MLDNILDGLKGEMTSAIAEKTGMDMGQVEQTVPMAKESITEGMMSAVAGGKMTDVMGMFSGGGGNMMQNMVYQGMSNNFIGKMTSKLGIDSSMANTVSSMALPMIMSKIGGKATGADGNVSESGIMSALGMDAGGGMMDKVGGMLKGGMGNMGNMLGN